MYTNEIQTLEVELHKLDRFIHAERQRRKVLQGVLVSLGPSAPLLCLLQQLPVSLLPQLPPASRCQPPTQMLVDLPLILPTKPSPQACSFAPCADALPSEGTPPSHPLQHRVESRPRAAAGAT